MLRVLASHIARQLQLARQPIRVCLPQTAAFSGAAAPTRAVRQPKFGDGFPVSKQLTGLRDCLVQQPLSTGIIGLRHLSFHYKLQETTQKFKAALATPASAYEKAKAVAAETSASVYNNMPRQVKQWVTAAQPPGSLNRVITLQLEAMWQHHGGAIMAVGAITAAYVLWRLLYGLASVFVDLSDTSSLMGFMGVAGGTFLSSYLYMRRRYSLDPSTVYRLAMLKLNTHPGILEVMGAPIAGSSLRASVVTGGDLKFHGLLPRVQSKRLQMIFPLKGSECRGLVSLEAKKRRGRYFFKLLSVDVPSAVGGEQRIFLCGDESIYSRGGVLSELRDPFTRAMSLQDEYEKEDEEDAIIDHKEVEAEKAMRVVEQLERAPKPLDEGGGMYFYERVYFAAQRGMQQVRDAMKSKA